MRARALRRSVRVSISPTHTHGLARAKANVYMTSDYTPQYLPHFSTRNPIIARSSRCSMYGVLYLNGITSVYSLTRAELYPLNVTGPLTSLCRASQIMRSNVFVKSYCALGLPSGSHFGRWRSSSFCRSSFREIRQSSYILRVSRP